MGRLNYRKFKWGMTHDRSFEYGMKVKQWTTYLMTASGALSLRDWPAYMEHEAGLQGLHTLDLALRFGIIYLCSKFNEHTLIIRMFLTPKKAAEKAMCIELTIIQLWLAIATS